MKNYGLYTKSAAKAIKLSDRLICQTVEDGPIYICNGYFIFQLTAAEYDAIVRPVACCDPGTWDLRSGTRTPSTMDLVKLFHDTTAATADAPVLTACPMVFSLGKTEAVGYYSVDADLFAMYNRSFMAAVSGTVRAKSGTASAVVYSGKEPFAMILPIKPKAELARAVKAYFVDTPAPKKPSHEVGEWMDLAKRMEHERDENAAEAAKAHQETAAEKERADRLAQELEDARQALQDAAATAAAEKEHADRLAQELADVRQTCQEAPATSEPERLDTAAAITAATARFTAIPGVTATVKGAQTASPVIWLSGDAVKHADALSAAGARWSRKREAYYYRVA